MNTIEYMTAIYNADPGAWPMYATLEEFLAGFAKHLVKKIVALGAEDRLPEAFRAAGVNLEEVA